MDSNNKIFELQVTANEYKSSPSTVSFIMENYTAQEVVTVLSNFFRENPGVATLFGTALEIAKENPQKK